MTKLRLKELTIKSLATPTFSLFKLTFYTFKIITYSGTYARVPYIHI